MNVNKASFRLSSQQSDRARELVSPALVFLEPSQFGLGSALINHHWNDGASDKVMEELKTYQNDDGGFGNHLEVDIKSPASNPFAARLAMSMLLSLKDRPASALTEPLGRWLQENQDADGDWHFSADVYKDDLAPWFAAWTFPNLNPACCVAGLANRLGLATPEMLGRVERLFDEKANLEEASSGEFYNVLPYVDYLGGVDRPDRETWLDAVAANITRTAETGGYADAGHFFEHVVGGGPDLARRIPGSIMSKNVDQLLDEVEDDGGWPTPYDAAWRPSVTASALTVLARLRDGI